MSNVKKPLKLGYYCKYKDPKDGEERVGLVMNFDDDMAIVWKKDFYEQEPSRDGMPDMMKVGNPHPYPIPRYCVTKGYEPVPGSWKIDSVSI